MLESIYGFLEYWMLFAAFGIYFSSYIFNRLFDSYWVVLVEDISWLTFITSFFLFQCADNQAMIKYLFKVITSLAMRPGAGM